ncbi:hypothetical protein [Agrobacterium rosae]|uniref:hypothetical protein n=1 Tax=Agrobacterium rosae TaxID=1972867 RepID=UPI0020344FCF|nr:hypothetical protein [Agrobacterium rosae]MCM2431979.1 hypothetical protein [Agrobacterium rosae]
MLRVSHFLKLMRLNFEAHAKMGRPIPLETIPDVCELINHIERECELMENRIAGELIVPDFSSPSVTNIVSLAAFYEKRQRKNLPKPNDPA